MWRFRIVAPTVSKNACATSNFSTFSLVSLLGTTNQLPFCISSIPTSNIIFALWRKVRLFGAVRTWRLFRWSQRITALVIIKLLSTHTIYEYKRTNCFSFHNLRKHPFLLALRSWGRFARNVPSGEEREETDVFAGYSFHYWVNLEYFWRFTLLFG